MKDLGCLNAYSSEAPEIVKNCTHQVEDKIIRNCLHQITCKECGYTYTVDTSD